MTAFGREAPCRCVIHISRLHLPSVFIYSTLAAFFFVIGADFVNYLVPYEISVCLLIICGPFGM